MMKLMNVLCGHSYKKPPIWLMRQAGRYLPEYRAIRNQVRSFMELCLEPRWVVEITLQPLRRFDFDAAIIFSDILMVPYGLGQAVDFIEGKGPILGPLPDPVSFDPSSFHRRLETIYAALTETRRQLSPDKALIGFAGAPWTVLTYMCEGGSPKSFDRTKKLYWEQPHYFDQLFHLVITATITHVKAQVRAGADVIQLFDSWAGAVPAFLRDKMIYQPTAEIVKALRQDFPDLPIIGFPRGLSYLLEEYGEKTGVTAINLDPFTDPNKVNSHKVIQGGLDPVLLVVGGDVLQHQVRAYLQAFQGVPYIFNLGHGILPDTPLNHVEALFEILDDCSA
jgi:uroporphyrinogen decarboxylase